IWLACSSALFGERNFPPSLKLSGVMLRTPMMSVRSPIGSSWSLMCQLRDMVLTLIEVSEGFNVRYAKAYRTKEKGNERELIPLVNRNSFRRLGWCRIAASYWWQDWLQWLRSWLFQLRAILIAAICKGSSIVEWKSRHDATNLHT